jgi:Conjugal transfer protein TraD
MQNRIERTQALHDTRNWVQERRARTRQLIELGGLVQKAGLVELLHDDRSALLGAMMELADRLRGGREEGTGTDARTPAQLTAAWRHRGLRAFEADRDVTAA